MVYCIIGNKGMDSVVRCGDADLKLQEHLLHIYSTAATKLLEDYLSCVCYLTRSPRLEISQWPNKNNDWTLSISNFIDGQFIETSYKRLLGVYSDPTNDDIRTHLLRISKDAKNSDETLASINDTIPPNYTNLLITWWEATIKEKELNAEIPVSHDQCVTHRLHIRFTQKYIDQVHPPTAMDLSRVSLAEAAGNIITYAKQSEKAYAVQMVTLSPESLKLQQKAAHIRSIIISIYNTLDAALPDIREATNNPGLRISSKVDQYEHSVLLSETQHAPAIIITFDDLQCSVQRVKYLLLESLGAVKGEDGIRLYIADDSNHYARNRHMLLGRDKLSLIMEISGQTLDNIGKLYARSIDDLVPFPNKVRKSSIKSGGIDNNVRKSSGKSGIVPPNGDTHHDPIIRNNEMWAIIVLIISFVCYSYLWALYLSKK